MYLSTSQSVTIVGGYVRVDFSQGTGTPTVDDCAVPVLCQPCDQPSALDSHGSTRGAALPTMAMDPNGCLDCVSWSGRVKRLRQQQLIRSELSLAAQKRRPVYPKRKKDGATAVITFEADVPTIGDRHRSPILLDAQQCRIWTGLVIRHRSPCNLHWLQSRGSRRGETGTPSRVERTHHSSRGGVA